MIKIEPPKVQVNISDGTPEDFARMATARIVSVSQTAPDPIRQQAEAFAVQVEKIVAMYIHKAIQSDRARRV